VYQQVRPQKCTYKNKSVQISLAVICLIYGQLPRLPHAAPFGKKTGSTSQAETMGKKIKKRPKKTALKA
jgi:hypothetical protein